MKRRGVIQAYFPAPVVKLLLSLCLFSLLGRGCRHPTPGPGGSQWQAAISESIHLLLFISAALAKSMHARLSLLRDEGPNGYDGTGRQSRPLCRLKSSTRPQPTGVFSAYMPRAFQHAVGLVAKPFWLSPPLWQSTPQHAQVSWPSTDGRRRGFRSSSGGSGGRGLRLGHPSSSPEEAAEEPLWCLRSVQTHQDALVSRLPTKSVCLCT